MIVYGIVYKATNRVNNKVYIGQTTKNLSERSYGHIRRANSKKCQHFHNAIRKYGVSNFLWTIIGSAKDKEELSALEKLYIQKYLSFDRSHGYNSTYGGENGLWTEETRMRVSLSLKALGIKLSDEHKERLRAINKGRKHTIEARAKISESGRRQCKEETKEKIRGAQIGRPKPKEYVDKMKLRRASEETRKKQSAARDLIKYPMPSRKGAKLTTEQIERMKERNRARRELGEKPQSDADRV